MPRLRAPISSRPPRHGERGQGVRAAVGYPLPPLRRGPSHGCPIVGKGARLRGRRQDPPAAPLLTRDSGRDRDRTGKGKGRGSGGPKGGRPQLISARSPRVGAGGSRGSDFGPGRAGRNPTLGGRLGEGSLKLSYGAFSGDLYIRPSLILARVETSSWRRAAGGMIHCPTISIPDRR